MSLCCQSCPSLTVSAPMSVPTIFVFSRTFYKRNLVVNTYKGFPDPVPLCVCGGGGVYVWVCVWVCRLPTPVSNSPTSLGSLRLQLDSDTVYPGLEADSTVKGSVPGDCPPF